MTPTLLLCAVLVTSCGDLARTQNIVTPDFADRVAAQMPNPAKARNELLRTNILVDDGTCGSDTFGCYEPGIIRVRAGYSCMELAHEAIHAALYGIYRDPDGNHNAVDYQAIMSDVCKGA